MTFTTTQVMQCSSLCSSWRLFCRADGLLPKVQVLNRDTTATSQAYFLFKTTGSVALTHSVSCSNILWSQPGKESNTALHVLSYQIIVVFDVEDQANTGIYPLRMKGLVCGTMWTSEINIPHLSTSWHPEKEST